MIRFYRHEQIDFAKWDNCISLAENSLIYGYSWYLDLVCKKWDALIEDDYSAVFPLTGNKKYGINYLFPPPFTQQLGIFSVNPLNDNKITAFIEGIPPSFRYIEINLNFRNNKIGTQFNITKQLNHVMDLRENYTEINKKYSQNAKRNIKNAETAGIKLSSDFTPDDIIQLFRANKGKVFSHLKEGHYQILKNLCSHLEEKRMVTYNYAITEHGELCAGIIWITDERRTTFLFSASSEAAKQTGAMSWLIDNFIKTHTGKELILDFEGSNNPGLARFYKSFGSKEEYYLKLRINRLPAIVKWFKH